MTTYNHMLEVIQTPGLSISQKLHELFKGAKSKPLDECYDDEQARMIPAVLHEKNAECVHTDNWGQTLTFRLDDDTYVMVDSGTFNEQGTEFAVFPYDEDEYALDEDGLWDYFMSEDDTPLAFYHGGFIDDDLEKSFLASFPEQS